VRVEADAIQVRRDEVLALAEALTTIARPSAFGVAIARQLALDGGSPLFVQGPDRRHGAERRLACTLESAQRALRVSADFDHLSTCPSSTERKESQDGG